MMASAGYNPIEMAAFFEKLEQRGGPGVPEFLSDHPSTGNRIQDVRAVINVLAGRSYNYSTGQFRQAKNLVSQLPPPRKVPRTASSR